MCTCVCVCVCVTDRQTDRQTDKQADRRRQTEIETEILLYKNLIARTCQSKYLILSQIPPGNGHTVYKIH